MSWKTPGGNRCEGRKKCLGAGGRRRRWCARNVGAFVSVVVQGRKACCHPIMSGRLPGARAYKHTRAHTWKSSALLMHAKSRYTLTHIARNGNELLHLFKKPFGTAFDRGTEVD